MTLSRCNQILDWIEQGYELSPQDLRALLRDALYAHKRLIKAIDTKPQEAPCRD